MNSVRVAIIDNFPLFRLGIATTLCSENRYQIVGEASSHREAEKLNHEVAPDILLLEMTCANAVSKTLSGLRNTAPKLSTIIMSSVDEAEPVQKTIEAGARGYFLKSECGRSLCQAVNSVLKGETYIAPNLAARLFERMRGHRTKAMMRPGLSDLTRREAEILYCVGLGFSNKEIGRKLSISDKTVKHHLTVIFQKLDVKNRVQAALIAQKSPDAVAAARTAA